MKCASSPIEISRRRACYGIGAMLVSTGCRPSEGDREVVAYVALDAEFSEPLLDRYARRTGVRVRPVFDIESTKTVGLVNRILAERRRPRCDLFWNNEILHTIRMQQLGLLQPFDPPKDYEAPEGLRDARSHWFGFAARARILLVRREVMQAGKAPASVLELTHQRWSGRCGIARPLFGTTATHAAVFRAEWGAERFRSFYRQVAANARVYSGNRQVAEAVAKGELDWGITDTDDAIVQIEKGNPVEIVFPDQRSDDFGVLLIPNTVCCLRQAPHADEAIRLAQFVLSREVEIALARGPSAQIPLRNDIRKESRIVPAQPLKIMGADYHQAAREWEATAHDLQQIFLTESR